MATIMSASDSYPFTTAATLRLLDDLPFSLMVYSRDGTLRAMNRRAEEFWSVGREAIVGAFNVLEDAQSVAQGSRERFARALAGETVLTEPQLYDTSQVDLDVEQRSDRQIWFRARMVPLRDDDGSPGHVALIHEDVTEEIVHGEAIARAQAEIQGQRDAIDALASPIIQVWDGILTVPLVGALDERRTLYMTERLLEAIVEFQADIVILDITGVAVVDTRVASALLQAARATALLGCRPVLVGLRSEVAQTMVQLGIDLGQIVTLANLKAGLVWAFAQQGLEVSAKRKA
jgi:anti-anti-sigma regulatory factor